MKAGSDDPGEVLHGLEPWEQAFRAWLAPRMQNLENVTFQYGDAALASMVGALRDAFEAGWRAARESDRRPGA